MAFYGRGDSQLTWCGNYAVLSILISMALGRVIDLVNDPERAADPEISAFILWEGMVSGRFTGRGLADYIRPGNPDYVGARRIVNGTDKAALIAGYAREFETALRLSAGSGAVTSSPAPADQRHVSIRTLGNRLNLRERHSLDADVMAAIPNGSIVPVSGEFRDDGDIRWLNVVFQNTEGWIVADPYTQPAS